MRVLTEREARLEGDLVRLPDGGMLLEAFDGFVVGLALCPVDVPASEWLPFVFDATPEPTFPEGLEMPDTLLEDLLWYCDRIARTLARHPDRYEALLGRLERDDVPEDEVIWELWANGFGLGLNLRPKAWTTYTLDRRANQALLGLMALAGIAARREEGLADEADPSLFPELNETIDATAPDVITTWVRIIAEHARAMAAPAVQPGRNDPCPCGSGRKFKKCCGAD
ncbi:UPF0149 family protein [Salinarimonas sp.]|uniref:UPF0149 family protein n=1 Tax=Salinarimonas sp. TaxID=2766526 RepID=UPI0032D99A72